MAGQVKRLASGAAVVAAWVWLVLLVVLAALGLIFGIGPVQDLVTWLTVKTGNLVGFELLIPILFLSLPAVTVVTSDGHRRRQAGQRPISEYKQAMMLAGGLFAICGLCVAGAAYAFVQSQRAPTQVTTITGAPIAGTEVSFVQPGKGSSTRWTYAAFVPGARRSDLAKQSVGHPGVGAVPVVLFVEVPGRNVDSGNYQPPEQDRMVGYLVQNGLPDHARIALEQQGVRIAPTYYVLQVRPEGAGSDYFVGVLLGGFFAFAAGAVGMMVAIRGWLARVRVG